jgi:hypothetical protein
MEPECSLTHSQVPSICPYLEPDRSSPYPHISLPEYLFNIILPPTPGSTKWSLSLRFPHQNPVYHNKWVPVTMAWRVLRLRLKKLPLLWRVASKILNKQSRTVDKEWSSSLGIGWGVTTPQFRNLSRYESFTRTSELDWSIIIIVSYISSPYKVLITCMNHAVPRCVI